MRSGSDRGRAARLRGGVQGRGNARQGPEGLVSARHPGEGLVVLSVGSEQGVRIGMRFRIEGGTDALAAGLVEVVRVHADVSEARILEGNAQRGDRVRTETP